MQINCLAYMNAKEAYFDPVAMALQAHEFARSILNPVRNIARTGLNEASLSGALAKFNSETKHFELSLHEIEMWRTFKPYFGVHIPSGLHSFGCV